MLPVVVYLSREKSVMELVPDKFAKCVDQVVDV